jgi:hypothetical protein
LFTTKPKSLEKSSRHSTQIKTIRIIHREFGKLENKLEKTEKAKVKREKNEKKMETKENFEKKRREKLSGARALSSLFFISAM